MPEVINPDILNTNFVDEDLANGVAGTPVPAQWFTFVQSSIQKNKTTADSAIADLANDKAGRADTQKSIADLSKTQTNNYTGYDDKPLFSISPLEYLHGGMSDKWTLANGSGVPIGDGFDLAAAQNYLDSGFVVNFNASIDAFERLPPRKELEIIPARISISNDTLWIPDLITFGAFFRAGANAGMLQSDTIRNIAGRTGLLVTSNFAVGAFVNVQEGYQGVISGGHYSRSTGYSSFSASRMVPTSHENRPVNIQTPVYFKIK